MEKYYIFGNHSVYKIHSLSVLAPVGTRKIPLSITTYPMQVCGKLYHALALIL